MCKLQSRCCLSGVEFITTGKERGYFKCRACQDICDILEELNLRQIILTRDEVGWYGRIPDSDDGHGNEIDCRFPTPTQSLNSLLEQADKVESKSKSKGRGTAI